ncbi:hypothetical protein D9613_010232 [Agrocybe pediades]|uniref:Uncharacterized protein n=1 Tax=Agrocybe pediades TaxID=84607 RepID=A0A8H4QFI1_9AGAR|nr:hypothetical protein D9613_010232 [Agrocybe pediades]
MAQFLFGIYTGLFPATIYLCVHKENRTRSGARIVIGSLTALYVVTAIQISVTWLYTNIVLCTDGGTRADTFIESVTGDLPLNTAERVIVDVTALIVFLFADGLLVWRCVHACGRSLRKSFLPIALFAVETGLVLTTMVYECLLDARPDFDTEKTFHVANRLQAATRVSVAATSVVSTVVICLQIWRLTTRRSRSWIHYRTIIRALIESSAIYSVTILFVAILDFTIAQDLESSFTVVLIANIVVTCTQIISGLAPTLMIGRLFLPSNQEDTKDSSVRLPSELIDGVSHAVDSDMGNGEHDLEMQQNGSVTGVTQEATGSEEIMS